MKTKLEVFDPPMCCSTGVCGANVDPALPRFAGDLKWLKSQGVDVARHNLAHQPMAFADNAVVKAAMSEDEECLPLVLLDGRIVSRRTYPTRSEMATAVCDRNESPETETPALAELAAQHAQQTVVTSIAPPSCGCSERRNTRCW